MAERSMIEKSDLHNKASKECMAALYQVLKAGGTVEELLVTLESVIFGVALTVIKFGGDAIILDAMMERVKGRLAEKRAADPQNKPN
jgi:hypothetical protein